MRIACYFLAAGILAGCGEAKQSVQVSPTQPDSGIVTPTVSLISQISPSSWQTQALTFEIYDSRSARIHWITDIVPSYPETNGPAECMCDLTIDIVSSSEVKFTCNATIITNTTWAYDMNQLNQFQINQVCSPFDFADGTVDESGNLELTYSIAGITNMTPIILYPISK